MNFTLIGTFGGLLWATAPAKEEAEFYKTRLKEYRWTLSVSSQRARFLDYAVKMLDASRNMLRNLAEKPSLSRVNSAGVPQGGEGEGEVDVSMGEDTPPLTRNTSLSNMSASVFSGFSGDALEQYTASMTARGSSSSSRPRIQSMTGTSVAEGSEQAGRSPSSTMEE
jgi:hypothetical protein